MLRWLREYFVHNSSRQIEFLQEQTEILRSKIPGPIRLTDSERNRLLHLGLPLKDQVRSLISVVTYETFQRWVRETGWDSPYQSLPLQNILKSCGDCHPGLFWK